MSERKRSPRPPYRPEVQERAVRMVFDHEHEYPSQWKAIESISAKDTPTGSDPVSPP